MSLLESLVFQIIEVFCFPKGYNSKFEKFVNNRKNSTFVRIIEKEIEEKFQGIL